MLPSVDVFTILVLSTALKMFISFSNNQCDVEGETMSVNPLFTPKSMENAAQQAQKCCNEILSPNPSTGASALEYFEAVLVSTDS